MVRAPTLLECPRCRAANTPAPSTDLGETAVLADEGSASSPGNLPSRAVLATIPLLWLAFWMVTLMSGRFGRLLSYTSGGWVSTALALAVSLGVCIPASVWLTRHAGRLSIQGQRASGLAIGLAMLLGVAPLIGRVVYRGLEAANTSGLEAQAPESAECRWTVARQQLSRTGTVLRVTVAATCTLPSGSSLEIDIPLESATVVQGERLVVPTWPGHLYGRLIAIDVEELAPGESTY